MCWSAPNGNGRCTDLLKTGVTEDECCNGADSTNSGITSTAYSQDLDSGKLFYYRALRGGVPCSQCKSTCEGITCGTGKTCVVKAEGQPVCICAPKCSRRKRKLGPVCGSDGQTYRHICRLLKRKCRKDPTLTVEYYGNCKETCDRVGCVQSKTCILDDNARPRCVRCQQYCPPVTPNSRPVCGANRVTYYSYCHLRRAACLAGRAIQVMNRRQCQHKSSNDEEIDTKSLAKSKTPNIAALEHRTSYDINLQFKPSLIQQNSNTIRDDFNGKDKSSEPTVPSAEVKSDPTTPTLISRADKSKDQKSDEKDISSKSTPNMT
ncbi:unnamed protein product [Medioppia subpectinata]|uniref:Kazal-like domain-containing protein n=1 Tax=Medioppia subpectinata TaxID=1979941 RepID=A0A7R9KNR3_9ACAR|nr:unnamed protein product [Medioppia subpectinata]CAG2105819.1 unnamed protein product [Medioppia subpectinata]